MRIIDQNRDEPLDGITIMLTPSEAAELASKIKNLDIATGDHAHVFDADYKREIIVAVYTTENLHLFHDKVRRAILEND
jgi:hypothetical protein